MVLFDYTRTKMRIELENPVVTSGDKLKGKVFLTVKKQVKSKGLTLSLVRESKGSKTVNGKSQTTTKKQVFGELTLDAPKEYMPGEFSFNFEMNVPDFKGQGGSFGSALIGVVDFFTRASYYLQGRLSIPWSIDRREKVYITINSKSKEANI
jgi:hypothetical protein